MLTVGTKMHRTRTKFLAAAAIIAVACGGGDAGESGSDTTPVDTTPPQTTTSDPAQITAAMVARGNDIFHGRAANGICYTCHGMNGIGGTGGLGPNLTDDQWLNTDGSYGGIIETIRTGVAQPVEAPAPMPPMGGLALSDEDLRAVAAYEYSLSHPEVPQPAP
jgi:mono/diheme cytochrome c family protein